MSWYQGCLYLMSILHIHTSVLRVLVAKQKVERSMRAPKSELDLMDRLIPTFDEVDYITYDFCTSFPLSSFGLWRTHFWNSWFGCGRQQCLPILANVRYDSPCPLLFRLVFQHLSLMCIYSQSLTDNNDVVQNITASRNILCLCY